MRKEIYKLCSLGTGHLGLGEGGRCGDNLDAHVRLLPPGVAGRAPRGADVGVRVLLSLGRPGIA